MSDTPIIQTDTENDRPSVPLWKQAVGAVVGGLVALTAYGMYKAVTPVLASIVGDDTGTSTQEEQVRDALYEDIANSARAISERLIEENAL